jgi:hypothetical protein
VSRIVSLTPQFGQFKEPSPPYSFFLIKKSQRRQVIPYEMKNAAIVFAIKIIAE